MVAVQARLVASAIGAPMAETGEDDLPFGGRRDAGRAAFAGAAVSPKGVDSLRISGTPRFHTEPVPLAVCGAISPYFLAVRCPILCLPCLHRLRMSSTRGRLRRLHSLRIGGAVASVPLPLSLGMRDVIGCPRRPHPLRIRSPPGRIAGFVLRPRRPHPLRIRSPPGRRVNPSRFRVPIWHGSGLASPSGLAGRSAAV